jgi:hypothetical protein
MTWDLVLELRRLDRKADLVAEKLDALAGALAERGAALDAIRPGFAGLVERLDRVDARLERIDGRLDRIERRLVPDPG